MALNLSLFLAENVEKPENVKFPATTRIKDETGCPVEWEIRALTSAEDDELRKASVRRTPVPGRKNQYTNDLDMNIYLAKLGAAATVYPPLSDASLQKSYGVNGAESLLKAMLTAGEYMNYLARVQEVSGFTALQDEVNEAKN